MNAQRLTIITAVVLVLAVFGFIIYSRTRPATATQATDAGQSAASQTPPDPSKLSYEGQPSLGDPNAPVKLAMFEDFKCPACKGFEETVWPKLERDYISSGKAQVYFIYYQIIPNSVVAGVAGECVFEQKPDLFWEYKTIVYRSQGNEAQDWATANKMVELAKTYVPDINADELNTCLTENRHASKIEADKAMGDAVGVTGTPSLFVNGQKFEPTAKTYDEFYDQLKAMIDGAADKTEPSSNE
jgi:protein-disulfide isomerase